jgi:hypothetical protein
MSIRLHSVVLHLDTSCLYAIVDCPYGRRKIKVVWQTKEQGDYPPEDWFDMVVKEVEFRLSQRGKIG